MVAIYDVDHSQLQFLLIFFCCHSFYLLLLLLCVVLLLKSEYGQRYQPSREWTHWTVIASNHVLFVTRAQTWRSHSLP